MKKTGRTLLATAAMTGLLSGVAVHQSHAQGTNTTTNAAAGKAAPSGLTPKVHGCSGENECKGVGGCKTADHTCKYKNDCKGKGGCELSDKDIKDWEKQQKADKKNDKPAATPAKSA